MTPQRNNNTPCQKAVEYSAKENMVKESDPSDKAEDTNKENEPNVLNLKNENDPQINFPRKLSDEKVWAPNAQHSPKNQTVIIFDWDDTLLCTSFLCLQDEQALSDVVQQYVQEIGAAVKRLLELSMRLGHTFIITNAMKGWVEYTAAKWIPDLLPVLQKVNVISARTKYEPQFPGEVNEWKIQAFLEVQKQFDSQINANLISVGDSNYEMEAVQVMGQKFSQAFIKTIKFLESPSPEKLLKQLQLLTPKFEQIVKKTRNFAGGAIGR